MKVSVNRGSSAHLPSNEIMADGCGEEDRLEVN